MPPRKNADSRRETEKTLAACQVRLISTISKSGRLGVAVCALGVAVTQAYVAGRLDSDSHPRPRTATPVGRTRGPMDPKPQCLCGGRAQMPGANGPSGAGARGYAGEWTQNRLGPDPFWFRP